MAEELSGHRRGARGGLRAARRWVRASAANALEVVRIGRLGPVYHAPFEVLEQAKDFRLRRYGPVANGEPPPVLLVPPLMMTAEVYDVAPEVSAVNFLVAQGIDTWVIDFGAPEREAGGMARTLDDHVRAVSRAIDRVRELTGRDVHLAGYSQGGMFAYQTAAYRRSAGVASVITFGSPVDMYRSVPNVSRDLVGLFARGARPVVAPIAERIQGLPGMLSSVGFKVLTPVKELEQIVDFVKKLHDRQALVKRESRRRFLGGEGFVAWPGPALRTFLDEIIVHNRMLSGGMVLDGRTVTLADITCPVLAFVGSRDTFARPPAVRAIVRAAPRAEVHLAPLEAGHFGLVVGSRALGETWPAVAEWVRWRGGAAKRPAILAERPAPSLDDEPEEAAFAVEIDLALDVVSDAVARVVRRAGDAVRDAGDSLASLRWQVPRLTELERMGPDTKVGPARALAERARTMPESTFFLWNGRAFTYADADARVGHVARGLFACGVRPGDRVAVVMAGRPSFLSVITALDRLRAVSIVLPPSTTRLELESVLARTSPGFFIADPERAPDARAAFGRDVLVLGGGGGPRDLGPGLVDMESIDPARVDLGTVTLDDGAAKDVAVVLALRGASDELRLAPITRHRWALSAIGAAAACTLRPDDTVYCCLPLHHPAGLLVSVGSALASGARLALSADFDPSTFWSEVRRYGATVAFYAGEMLRPLADAPPTPHDRDHPLRVFAGSGMREDLWRRLVERFGVGLLEFYAATTQNVVLANASGEKLGAIGRPLPGSTEVAVVRYDLTAGAPEKDAQGHFVRARDGEAGLGLARLSAEPVPGHEGRVLTGVFEPGDRWFSSGDILRRDEDGDFWFEDRVSGMLPAADGFVSSRRVEGALYRLAEVRLAACYASSEGLTAAVVTSEPLDAARFSRTLAEELAPRERPRVVQRVASIPTTDGFQPIKRVLREGEAEVLERIVYDEASGRYG